MTWLEHVREDPLAWLLSPSDPAVRAATMCRLLHLPRDAPQVTRSRRAAMTAEPIRSILAAQDPEGWWSKPGPGYGPKYRGTAWQVMFLDQLGADGEHPQVARACDYVLEWCPTTAGGFGMSGRGKEVAPPASSVVHCLNGNLSRALIGFGRLDHERVQAAVEWATTRITAEGVERWYASGTSGPGFACGANDELPCAWGAVKELAALARIPAERRTPPVQRAIDTGVEFLLSHDPAAADYPMGWGNTKPNSSWFKFGFPSGYVADVLQNAEVLAELGHAQDPRLADALSLIESRQDDNGRWMNHYAYNGKTWVDFEPQGSPSKWVTLRACTVLQAAYG